MWTGCRPESVHLSGPGPKEGASGVMEPLRRSEFPGRDRSRNFGGYSVPRAMKGGLLVFREDPGRLGVINRALRNEQE